MTISSTKAHWRRALSVRKQKWSKSFAGKHRQNPDGSESAKRWVSNTWEWSHIPDWTGHPGMTQWLLVIQGWQCAGKGCRAHSTSWGVWGPLTSVVEMFWHLPVYKLTYDHISPWIKKKKKDASSFFHYVFSWLFLMKLMINTILNKSLGLVHKCCHFKFVPVSIYW